MHRLTGLENKFANNVKITTILGSIRNNFHKRFPISDEAIAASLLDPSVQHLPVLNDILNSKCVTKLEFFNSMLLKYKISSTTPIVSNHKFLLIIH